MTIFHRILIVTLIASMTLLVACNESAKEAKTEVIEKGPASQFQQVKHFNAETHRDIADKYKKSSELMFNILAAEISGRRQEMKVSLAHYLKAIAISENPRLAERATELALFAKNIKAALVASKRWAELAPKNPEPHRFIAILHLRKGEKEKSLAKLREYDKMLSANNKNRFARIIKLYSQESNRKLAFEVVQQFIREHKDNAVALYAFSRFALQMRRYKVALKSIDKAIVLKTSWHRAKLLRARILMSSGQKKRAIREMYLVMKANPSSKAMRVNYARLLTEAKKFKQARRQFEILLKQKPNDSDILYALALLSLEGKTLAIASKYFKRMIATGRRQNEGFYHLGLIEEDRRRYDAAILWLSKVKPGDRQIDAHLRIASIMSKKGDVEAARRFLYQLKPRTKRLEVRLYLTEADILNRASRQQDAMDVINNALNAHAKNYDLLFARAMMAEKLNQIDIVERDLKTIIKKQPKNAQALNALGYTLADRTKRYKEAYGYIKQAFDLSPNQPAIVDSMGWVEYRLGNLKESVVHLRRALKLDSNAEIAAHLGEVLWVMGSKKEAHSTWKKGIEIDKNNKTLKATMDRLIK